MWRISVDFSVTPCFIFHVTAGYAKIAWTLQTQCISGYKLTKSKISNRSQRGKYVERCVQIGKDVLKMTSQCFNFFKNDVTMFQLLLKWRYNVSWTRQAWNYTEIHSYPDCWLLSSWNEMGGNCPNGRGSNPQSCGFGEEVMTYVGHSDEGNKDNSDDDDNDK